MCIFGGFLFLVTMQFLKPYKSIADQLARMEERRMIVDLPREQALATLDSITYYRFTGYALAFLDKATDCYTDSLTFSDILALYQFDAASLGIGGRHDVRLDEHAHERHEA